MAVRQNKERIVREIADRIRRSKAIILTDYRGLTVAQMTDLRRKLREIGVEYKVVKNSLARRATDDPRVAAFLEGPTAIAFGYDDPISPARALTEFARNNKELEIKGGLVEGQLLDEAGVRFLASLPSREFLVARVAGAIQSPLVAVVRCLRNPLQSMARGLETLRQRRAGEETA